MNEKFDDAEPNISLALILAKQVKEGWMIEGDQQGDMVQYTESVALSATSMINSHNICAPYELLKCPTRISSQVWKDFLLSWVSEENVRRYGERRS